MVAAYSNADCVIYDIETGNPVIKLETTQVWIIWKQKVVKNIGIFRFSKKTFTHCSDFSNWTTQKVKKVLKN